MLTRNLFASVSSTCGSSRSSFLSSAAELRIALAQALHKLRFKNAPLGISEESRLKLAEEAIAELRLYGGWKELDEEAPMRPLASGDSPNDKRESFNVKPE